ncbi:hypothetical protein T03_11100 [Trichinella britovi]|uniref:Uncharacterized protein n=2 Tax=Trichinella TaxID=6333 RepID=A0A0V1CGA7_TRIBR|nr:hypothetical protein T05_4239 [Trichinella murrelli]KRX54229.1 hypothetical protein T09_13337 [Trichinella sp. T9]KRY48340.1 hypothetical protein T03_11100 [Trichinella britovi]
MHDRQRGKLFITRLAVIVVIVVDVAFCLSLSGLRPTVVCPYLALSPLRLRFGPPQLQALRFQIRKQLVLNWSSTRTRQCVEHTRDAAAVGLIRAFQSRERKLAYCHIWADACFAADKQAQSAGNDHVGNSSCRGYRRGKWRNSNEPLLLYKRPPTVALANLACDSPQIAQAYNYQEQLIQNWNRSVVTVSVDNVVWVTVSAPQGRVAQWRRMSRPSALFSEAAASNLGSPPVS